MHAKSLKILILRQKFRRNKCCFFIKTNANSPDHGISLENELELFKPI